MASQYRFFTPPSLKTATGRAGTVAAQLTAEFPAASPTFSALSAVPELMAATWALLRESLLVGDASRVAKEVVATAVSRANRCRFCVDAHTVLLHALGEHELAEQVARGDRPADPALAALVRWAKATRTPRPGGPPAPGEHAAEYLGTALTFHFINRVVSALLSENLLPGGVQRSPVVRNVGGRVYARTIRRTLEPGRSLALLDDLPAGPAPAWAGGSPIGVAYAAHNAAAWLGGAILGESARQLVADTVSKLDGAHPARPHEWATELATALPAQQRVGARLALLAAVAPSAISQGDVGLWRLSRPADADLVRVVAYGAIVAVDHVEARLNPLIGAR